MRTKTQKSIRKRRMNPHALKYEKLRERGKKNWPTYQQMRIWFKDKRLSFEDIAGFCGTSRERIRQVSDDCFPGVRPAHLRRLRCGRNFITERKARFARMREKAEEEFRKGNRIYRMLAALAAREKINIDLAWGKNGTPRERSYVVCGKKVHLVTITSATQPRGCKNLYAATNGPELHRKLGEHDLVGVLLNIRQKNLRLRQVYVAPARRFLESGLEFILIRLEKGRRQGPPTRFPWNQYVGFGPALKELA